MTSTTADVAIARIQALLDRLDPHPAATCAVPGCEHDAAPVRIDAFRRRPPSPARGRTATPQAA